MENEVGKERRGKVEVIADMLRLRVQSKTQLYFNSGLSHSLFKRYMALLVLKGFIIQVHNKDKPVFERTSKGKAILSDIDCLMEKVK